MTTTTADLDEIKYISQSTLSGMSNTNDSDITFVEFPITAYITETYHSGYSWYRVYSDGWCEQGGKVTPSGSSATTSTVTLLKPYKLNNYFVVANYESTSSNQYGQCYDLTTSSFKTKSYGGNTNSWYACGYID